MALNITLSNQSAMVLQNRSPHFVLLPFFTTSHMIPLVELGRQLAAHGGKVTIITTPSNAAVFQSSIDQSTESGHQISVHTLKFPSAEVGLQEGIENYSAITSPEMLTKVGYGIAFLQKPMDKLIRDLSPNCIISDMFFPWTVDTAEQLQIPRLLFYPSSSFCNCISDSLKTYNPHEKIKNDSEYFLVPELPDKIEMTRYRLPDHLKSKTKYGEFIDQIKASESRSFGVIFDSFYELEANYVNHFKKSKKMKAWHVGPLCYFSKLKSSSMDSKDHSLSWLNTQRGNTVIYICFGSMTNFSDAQLKEIALALENIAVPFIWVVGEREKSKQEKSWMPEGFEKWVAESKMGVVITGWAPQVQILNHPAVGGYVTHCGWNSVMESMRAGVPLITWPLFAEQFFNEKFINDVLRIGVEVGSEVWNSGFQITSPVVRKEKIEKAVKFIMGGSGESEEIRSRVRELGLMSTKAVDDGGSSHKDLIGLLKEIQDCCMGEIEKV